VQAAACGIFPLGLCGKTITVLREVAVACGEVITGNKPVARTEPVAESSGPNPADAGNGVVFFAVPYGEDAISPDNPTETIRGKGITVDLPVADMGVYP